jgi:hypothetical protein
MVLVMPGMAVAVAMDVDMDSQLVVRARLIGVWAPSTAMSMTQTAARMTTCASALCYSYN